MLYDIFHISWRTLSHFCINLLNILAFFYWQRITVQDDYFFEKVIAWTFTWNQLWLGNLNNYKTDDIINPSSQLNFCLSVQWARDNKEISFSEVRLLEYPRGTRQIGHLFNFTRHLQQIVCPLLHWKTGLVSGICKQTGHSRCPAILDFRVSSFQSSSLKSIF